MKQSQLRRFRRIATGVFIGALLLIAVPASAHWEQSRTVAVEPDAEFEYLDSVVDLELPSVVGERVRNILGDRYVELWVDDDESSYVVGVLDLLPQEYDHLVDAIGGEAPIRLEHLSVSRSEVEGLYHEVQQAVDSGKAQVHGYGPAYHQGGVAIFVDDEQTLDVLAELVSGEVEVQVVDSVQASTSFTSASDSGAQLIVIRVVITEQEL